MTKEKLTNEELTTRCDNNFELAQMGIEIAHNMIHAQQEAPLGKVLDEIKRTLDREHKAHG